ncbi:MAG: TlpA family protein disulfide reductase [Acidobacteria bacterium]|nr:TlpA family protein disulfide reductase [Acidobacteriota bacterium]
MPYSLLTLFAGLLTAALVIGALFFRRRLKLLAGAWFATILVWGCLTWQIAPRTVGTSLAFFAPPVTFQLADGRKLATVPTINRLAESHKSDGLVVIGLSLDEDENAWRQYLAANSSSRLEARDPAGVIAAAFQSPTAPSFVLIDRKGTARWKLAGWTPYAFWILGRKTDRILGEL